MERGEVCVIEHVLAPTTRTHRCVPMVIKAVPLLIACLVPVQGFAWGAGHDYVNRLAVEMLRGVIRAESAANVVKWSHAPDDFAPWEKLKQCRISADDLRLVKAHKQDAAYSSHSAKGQAVVHRMAAAVPPRFLSGDPGEVLLDVMLSGLKSNGALLGAAQVVLRLSEPRRRSCCTIRSPA